MVKRYRRDLLIVKRRVTEEQLRSDQLNTGRLRSGRLRSGQLRSGQRKAAGRLTFVPFENATRLVIDPSFGL